MPVPVGGILLTTVLPTLTKAIASEFISNDKVIEWIGAVFGIIGHGAEIEEKLQPLIDQMEQLLAEKRPPTEDEWDVWRKRKESAEKTILDWRPEQ